MDDLDSLGSPAETEPLTGYRILVVDDDEDVRTFLLALFADAGAQISEAGDGYEALEKAVAERPDLIILDLSMPGRDGVEAFRDLRRNPETAETPVCIVTGHPEFRELLYSNAERSPEGYMNKPIDADELVKTVRRIFGLLQRRRERQAGQ
jgi:two-component system phosphate regulon response regulator PhoB